MENIYMNNLTYLLACFIFEFPKDPSKVDNTPYLLFNIIPLSL